MKNLKGYTEYITESLQGMDKIINFSKVRKFPERMYDIYDLSKDEVGKYLNTWFVGEVDINKRGILIRDEMWTVKKVDTETSDSLYGRKINPISITIMCPTGKKFDKNYTGDLYNMRATINSIDDSSFGIWWNYVPLEELKEIRIDLMGRVNEMGLFQGMNGGEFLESCIKRGADPDSVDYN